MKLGNLADLTTEADLAVRVWVAVKRCACGGGSCQYCTDDLARLAALGYVADGVWL